MTTNGRRLKIHCRSAAIRHVILYPNAHNRTKGSREPIAPAVKAAGCDKTIWDKLPDIRTVIEEAAGR